MKRVQKLVRQSVILGACVLCLAGIAIQRVQAQPAWRPDKPVEIVTSSAAGGSNDAVARALQKIMQDNKLVPTPVTVLNKAGGNQTLSRAYLMQHQADAHYFDIGNPTLISNHILGITPQNYTDFTPIALLINEYTVFTVRADSPIKTVRDLLDRLKKSPDSVSIGVSNLGGTNHITISLAAKSVGVDPKRLKIVVFKSNSESMTAVLGGHLDMVAASVPSVIQQVLAGGARIIAAGAPQRMTGALADVPILREVGVKTVSSNWRAIIAPKGLSAAQIAYWEGVYGSIAKTDAWKKELEAQYWDGNFLGSKEFAKYMENDYNDTKAVLTDLGMTK